MKTTHEERLEYKKTRRLKNLTKLVQRLGLRVKSGNESQKQIECILERVSQLGFYPSIIDAFRRKQ